MKIRAELQISLLQIAYKIEYLMFLALEHLLKIQLSLIGQLVIVVFQIIELFKMQVNINKINKNPQPLTGLGIFY